MSERDRFGFGKRYVKNAVRALVGWGFHVPLSYMSTEWDEQVKPWLLAKGRAFREGVTRFRPKKEEEGPRSED